MLSRIGAYVRRHHVGLAALFVALGGTAYATGTVGPGSVGTAQLANGAVTASKLAPDVLGLLGGQEYATSGNGTVKPVLTVRVPAGSYLAVASIDALGPPGKTGEARCDLGSNQDPAGGGDTDSSQVFVASGNEVNIVGDTAVTIPKPGGTIRWQCTPLAGGFTYQYSRLVAVSVGTRH